MAEGVRFAPAVLLLTGLVFGGCSDDKSRPPPLGSTTAASTTQSTTSPAPTTSTTTAPTQTQSNPGSTPPPSTAIQGSFRVLSYNVAGLPQGLSQSSPLSNTPQISPMLNTYDLALAQEDFSYHHLLQQDARHSFQSTPQGAVGSLMNDGLNRFSNSSFTLFARTTWNTCHGVFNAANDCLASKGFSVARHELAPGITVDVYNLHADAGGSSGDQNARAAQFDQLATYILANSQNQALIVAGDTNLKVTSRATDDQTFTDFLNRTGLSDAARVLAFPERIDRVMYRSNGQVTLTPTLYRIADEFIDANNNPLSDHEGINVDFDWR